MKHETSVQASESSRCQGAWQGVCTCGASSIVINGPDGMRDAQLWGVRHVARCAIPVQRVVEPA